MRGRPKAELVLSEPERDALVALTVIAKALESVPVPDGATHWSTRTMTRRLRPHRQETFKLSTDPMFVDEVGDIVGLYMAPPLMAMVLCVDEKSQIQALDSTQP